MTNVLLFTNDKPFQHILGSALGASYSLRTETNTFELASTAARCAADLILIDINPEHFSLRDYIALIAGIAIANTAIVVMADSDSEAVALKLMDAGAHFYCRKPPAMRQVKAILARARDHSRVLRQQRGTSPPTARPTPGCDSLIGASAGMRAVYDLIRKVSALDAVVLVTGESGTGKELIARAIHNLSNRASKPFVGVSCAAIPESLMESELFGHEKGAFTGAMGHREGYFEQCRDGTLFLDEIGEVKPHTQVKLLRVLQQREFNRLGSSHGTPLRARLVLATHRDLGSMVAAGEFRQDLFYRINVINIDVPPLRQRTEDIPLLVNHFIRQYAESYCKPVCGIDSEAMSLLMSHRWPGNIRELENTIQRCIIMADRDSIGVRDVRGAIEISESSVDGDEEMPSGRFEQLLFNYKVTLARNAVQQCDGNKKKAAESLSISRAYLYRLIGVEGAKKIACKVDESGTEDRKSAAAAG